VTVVQRLFGNDYTGMPGLDARMAGVPGRRMVQGQVGGGLAIAWAVLVLAASAASGHVLPADPAYASADSGGVHIEVPSALPHIDLTQDANASVGASLVLDRIVEVTPSTTDPQIVAKATVTNVRSFNSTGAAGPHVLAGLTANLTVFQSSGDLFPVPGLESRFSPSIPIAPTTVVVTVLTTATPGTVSVAATIEGWPWTNAQDDLAVGWSFQVGHASGFSGCPRAVPSQVPATDCGADPFASSNSSWDDSWDGIQGVSTAGPEAQLGWNASFGSSVGDVPVIVGAQRTTGAGGSAEVVLGAAAAGATAITYGLSYALALPPTVSHLLHGTLVPYLGGAVAAALLAGGAVVYVRRRDRRVLDAL